MDLLGQGNRNLLGQLVLSEAFAICPGVLPLWAELRLSKVAVVLGAPSRHEQPEDYA